MQWPIYDGNQASREPRHFAQLSQLVNLGTFDTATCFLLMRSALIAEENSHDEINNNWCLSRGCAHSRLTSPRTGWRTRWRRRFWRWRLPRRWGLWRWRFPRWWSELRRRRLPRWWRAVRGWWFPRRRRAVRRRWFPWGRRALR